MMRIWAITKEAYNYSGQQFHGTTVDKRVSQWRRFEQRQSDPEQVQHIVLSISHNGHLREGLDDDLDAHLPHVDVVHI